MLALILVWFALSLLAGLYGRKRALRFWGFFIASIFLTPMVVLFILVLTASIGVEETYS
jgi:fumarate reductase subunit C